MGAIRTQIVFDATDPHALAAFWAEALHYEHEDVGAFVTSLVDAGHVPVEYTIEVDGKRRWRSVASLRHPDDPVDERGSGTGRRILFKQSPRPRPSRTESISISSSGPSITMRRSNVSWASARPLSASTTATRAGGHCWWILKATNSTFPDHQPLRTARPVGTRSLGLL